MDRRRVKLYYRRLSVADKGDTAHYPLSCIAVTDAIITICLKPNDILIEFSSSGSCVKTTMRTRFVFTLLLGSQINISIIYDKSTKYPTC